MTRAPSPQCGSLHVTPPIMLLMMVSRARDIGYLFIAESKYGCCDPTRPLFAGDPANRQTKSSCVVRRLPSDLRRQIQTVAVVFGGTTDKPFGLARQRPSPISVESPVTSIRYADP